MNTYPVTQLNADGDPETVVAVWPDIIGEIEPETEVAEVDRPQSGFAVIAAFVALTDGLKHLPADQRAKAYGGRVLSLLTRMGAQPLGCATLAELAREIGVSRNASWQAAERASERILAEPRDSAPKG